MKPGTLTCGLVSLVLAAELAGGPGLAPLGAALRHYTGLGFQHIIPHGPDHICFVLGLFFLSRNVTTLLWQVTAFTLAHSLTFGLMLCGFIELPARAVEIAVALSIVLVGVENLRPVGAGRWRTWIIVGFGLVHGLAFAHTFRGHAIPAGHFVPALFAFNLGIELGQVAVMALAFAIFGGFRERPWYRRAVTIPASALIATAGLVWAVARTPGLG